MATARILLHELLQQYVQLDIIKLGTWIGLRNPDKLGLAEPAVDILELLWSKDGEKAWQDFYRSIPDVDSGIVGSIIARSDAHTLG